jgi:hypothetical protein
VSGAPAKSGTFRFLAKSNIGSGKHWVSSCRGLDAVMAENVPFGREESTQWLSKGTILSAMFMVMLTLCIGC